MDTLDLVDHKILKYLRLMGPEYPWLLSLRIEIPYEEARERLERLRSAGHLTRVSGRIVTYRQQRRLKTTKHRNHTYYGLTRQGKASLKDLEAGREVDLNLHFPYKR
jgi:predicted transcriptional regulator